MIFKLANTFFLFLLFIFVSCSSIDEDAIVGTWEIDPNKCDLIIDQKILNVLPKELSDQIGGQLAMVPIMFKQGLKEESSNIKIKINEDGTWEPVVNQPIEDDVLEILKWFIDGNKLTINAFLHIGTIESSYFLPEETRNEIEENNKKALKEPKIEIVFDIKKLNETDMILLLDIESFINNAKEKGLVHEAEEELNRKLRDLKIDPEKILKLIAKNIKLTLAFKKV